MFEIKHVLHSESEEMITMMLITSPWQVLVYLLEVYILVQTSIVCSELYLHRCLSHKAMKLDWRLAILCHLELALFAGLNPIKWVWQHRWHHSHVDTRRDLFTPKETSLLDVFLFTPWYYFQGTKKHEARFKRFARRQPTNRIYEFQEEFPWGTGGLLLLALAFGPMRGLLLWLGHMLGFMIYWSCVTSFTHNAPGQPLPFVGCAVNLRIGKVLNFISMGGAKFHRDHHEDLQRADFGWKYGEWDPMYSIITFLARYNLATDIQ